MTIPLARRIAALTATLAIASTAEAKPKPQDGPFHPLSTFHVPGKVAEIVTATRDGQTLIYTDSLAGELGWVDISDPSRPRQKATLKVEGEPTSVAVSPDGRYLLASVDGRHRFKTSHVLVIDPKTRAVLRRMVLNGQPDAVAWSPDGRYATVVVEAERPDEARPLPSSPPGNLTILDAAGAPANWRLRIVPLTGLMDRFPTDPEPEYADINARNEAVVTLQENNGVVVVDLPSGRVLHHWSCGVVLHPADLHADGKTSFSDRLTDARREPDQVAWTPGGRILTANEGDYGLDLPEGEFVGGRGWTLFTPSGRVYWDAGATLEMAASRAGLYPDKRSEAHGVEMEGVKVARFGGVPYAFVGAERGGFVAVYDLQNEARPRLLQLLPTGQKPEGICAIPGRGLLATGNEGDGTISIFGMG